VPLTSLAAACGAAAVENSTDFLLRTDEFDVSQASGRFLDAVHDQLQQSDAVGEGYPALGDVVAEPSAADPAVETLHCSLDRPEGDGRQACILLDEAGDFIWIHSITWESAAFHLYRLYVAPRSMFARVDRNRDFVGLTVFIRNDFSLWETVDRAIRDAATEMGARPFRP
jgi:hypothetical protein